MLDQWNQRVCSVLHGCDASTLETILTAELENAAFNSASPFRDELGKPESSTPSVVAVRTGLRYFFATYGRSLPLSWVGSTVQMFSILRIAGNLAGAIFQ
jgi:hypothetical protein